jgi:biopolymer transport protein ExbB
MQSLAVGKLRSLLLSLLVGTAIVTMIVSTIALAPSVASAQDENPDDGGAKKVAKKGSSNPIAFFFGAMFHDLISATVSLMILGISVGMVALFIILLLDIRTGEAVPVAFVEEFTEMVNKRQFKQAFELCRTETSFIARVMTAGMGRLQYGIEDAREAMLATADSVKAGKESWISYLGVVGTLGPLLGLVGTVSGMIGAFKSLGEAEGAPNASLLAGEISTALVLTLLGVFIAVPAIFLFSFFKNRLTNISVNTVNLADDLLTQMYHNSKKAGSAAVERSTGVTSKG